MKEPFEFSIDELPSVIGNDCSGESESTNQFPTEVSYLGGRDISQGFSLNPFSKVVDRHQEEFLLCHSGRERPDDVHSPLGEWPRCHYGV